MNIITLNETMSTNTALKEMLRDGTADIGTAVYSPNQTSGYGRRGRFWHSEKGENISVSLALAPYEGDELISLTAGVAVLQALWEVCGGLPLKIKWPNDILLNGKKLCGISCEKIFVGGKQIIVLGIGLNVNNIDFPGELAETATSLRLATGRDWDLEGILYEIIHEIHMHINHLPKEQVLKVIQQNCINLGKHVRIINEGGLVAEGIATHIDADGGIVIITKDDTPQKYHSGEISLR